MYGTFASHHDREARSDDIEHQAGGAHAPSSIDDTTDDENQPLLSNTRAEMLSIRVETGASSRVFDISKVVICQYSGHIASLCNSTPSASSTITLAADATVFSLFISWLVAQPTPVSYDPDRPAAEPWVSLASAACILASQLKAPAFEKYALSQFIQNFALAPFGPWADIERDAPAKSSIRRFSNHWIAWNTHLAGSSVNEFSGLAAGQLASRVTGQTRDPRLYHIEHWYSDCGDSFEPGCEHHPSAQNAQQRPTQPKEPLRGQPTVSAEQERVRRPRTPPRTSAMVMRPPKTKSSPRRHTSSTSDDCCENCCACCIASIIPIIFIGIVTAILALSIILLHHGDAGIRYTTRTYTLFVACWALMVLIGPNGRVLIWYLLFAFADGIALAVDNRTCWSIAKSADPLEYNPTPDCQKMTALTALTWTNLIVAMIYVSFCVEVRKGMS